MIERHRRVDESDHVSQPVRLHDAPVTFGNQPPQRFVLDAPDLHTAYVARDITPSSVKLQTTEHSLFAVPTWDASLDMRDVVRVLD